MSIEQKLPIKVVIGLGNPGKQYQWTRHNCGFLVVDALAEKYGASWQTKGNKEVATIVINGENIVVVKPQTFMNSSGLVVPSFFKQGLSVENILVVHDELEKPFGVVETKVGGGHRGHNGLRSITASCGSNFARLRCGIGRPADKDKVPFYVIDPFSEPRIDVEAMVDKAVVLIENMVGHQ